MASAAFAVLLVLSIFVAFGSGKRLKCGNSAMEIDVSAAELGILVAEKG